MAIWNRKQKQLKENETLTEASKNRQLDITTLFGQPYYQFTSQLGTLRNSLTMTSVTKQAMLKDPIVTQIINMWISDTLNKDILSGKIFDIAVSDNHSGKGNINELLDKVKADLDYLLENSNLDDQLVSILYEIITNGICSVKLGFVDLYEDTKIKLFESNKKRLLNESEKIMTKSKDGENLKLLEAPTYDDYEDQTESYSMRTNRNGLRALGRYYFEILPQKIVPLQHKGITVLYMDLNNQLKVLNPRNITTFVNKRGGVKKLSIKDNPEDITSTLYEIPMGKSFVDQAVTPWSMYNTSQDCTILALMTRCSIYRLFQIDVGALSVKETEKLLQEFKTRITSRESIDVRSKHYSSSQTQLPLGDSILIPTRNGTGKMEVQSIGGDLNIQTTEPMEFFREEFLASLGIAKDLVYGADGGALINTSATRSDIRYLRLVQQFVSIMSLGLEDIFKDYLNMLGYDLSDFKVKVIFKQLNSEEALQKMEYEQTRQEALDRMITSLGNLGITFDGGKYVKTRNELIKRFMDEEILDLIQQDEKENPPEETPTEPSEDEGSDLDAMGPMSDFSDIDTAATDTDIPTDDTEVPSVDDSTEPTTEPSDSTSVNEEPPYSLG